MENVLSAPNHLDDPIYSEPLDEKFIPCVSVIHHLPVHSASQPTLVTLSAMIPTHPLQSIYHILVRWLSNAWTIGLSKWHGALDTLSPCFLG